MAPKRKAADADVAPRPAETYSPIFPLYPEADLVVRSSDGILFATRALFLRAASPVFDDILGLPVQDGHEKKDGLALIRIEEEAVAFEVFLRYAHGERLVVDGKVPEPNWTTVVRLSKMVDKYNASALGRSILLEQLPYFIGDPKDGTLARRDQATLPVQVFAIASIHGLEELCQRALRWSHFWGRASKGYRVMSHKSTTELGQLTTTDWRPSGVEDLEDDLLSRMTFPVIRRFCALHMKVLGVQGYSWMKAGDDFKL